MSNLKEKSSGVDYIEQKYGVTPPDMSVGHYDSLYSIYDKCSQLFLPPFPCATLEACKRSIVELLDKNQGGLLSKFPSDYDLYSLAKWDNKTGYISYDVPQRICSIFDLISRKEKTNEVSEQV